ncbi:MAG: hypothetical protein CMLOHMNK_00199 [Steroidobacteraceae bacterium]|nr:hypothetical protein [Steroidobacteraceae bacterium]
MDELAILRDQVATERRHLAAVKKACRAALQAGGGAQRLTDTCRAAASYLAFGARRLHAQDHAHCVLLRPRVPRGDTANHALLDDLEQTLKQLQGALQSLEAAADPVAGIGAYLDFIDNVLARRRHNLEHLFRTHYTIDDWRAASLVDADSILDERERFAAVRAAFPAGFSPEDGPAG